MAKCKCEYNQWHSLYRHYLCLHLVCALCRDYNSKEIMALRHISIKSAKRNARYSVWVIWVSVATVLHGFDIAATSHCWENRSIFEELKASTTMHRYNYIYVDSSAYWCNQMRSFNARHALVLTLLPKLTFSGADRRPRGLWDTTVIGK